MGFGADETGEPILLKPFGFKVDVLKVRITKSSIGVGR